MGRLFGTDGVRGIANTELTCERAMQIGRAAATVLSDGCRRRPLFVIGSDTRASSEMLGAAITAGLCSVGADVIQLGVIRIQPLSNSHVRKRKDDNAHHHHQEQKGRTASIVHARAFADIFHRQFLARFVAGNRFMFRAVAHKHAPKRGD